MRILVALSVLASLALAGCGEKADKVVPTDQAPKLSKDAKTKGGPPGATQM